LERNQELYRYEETERGDVEKILGEFLSGNVSFTEVLRTAHAKTRAQRQTVSQDQVGAIETVAPEVVQSPVQQTQESQIQVFEPSPPIMLYGVSSSKKKILTTSTRYPQINNFAMLLGLSDRLMQVESDFFRVPHTTRILWGGHRVIYIFTEATGRLSLYYDIELRDPIDSTKTGGGMFPTTTLIMKERIFVPVPDTLAEEFRIGEGPKEFLVRFDLLSSEPG
jgi:molecular chaperone HtpG